MKEALAETNWAALLAARARPPERSQIMHQRWEHLLFLHWPVSPELVQATLPAELTADTFEGMAYIAISPFFMRDVRPVGLPALPFLSNFQEMNVRTYVRAADDIPGIWFYSLDCNQALAAVGARFWTGLPYFYAAMGASVDGAIDFHSTRVGTQHSARYVYRAEGAEQPTKPGTFEFFALERYFLYSRRTASRPLRRGQVKHSPYQYRNVEVTTFSTLPAAFAGFTGLREPGHACVVDGFDVRIYSTEPVNR